MKQAAFAARLEIPVARLKNYEMARSPIRYQLARRVCPIFQINQKWLATGDQPSHHYFEFVPEFENSIPGRELFSVVYDRILWQFLDKATPRFSAFKLPFGMVRENSAPYLLSALQLKIEFASGSYPPEAIEHLTNSVAAALDEIEAKYREEIASYGRHAKEREARLKEFYSEMISRMLANPKSSNHSSDDRLSKYPFDLKIPLLDSAAISSAGARDEPSTSKSMSAKNLSRRIIDAREKASLSQKSASSKWRIALGTLRDWEQGRREPRGLYRERIEKILSEIEANPA